MVSPLFGNREKGMMVAMSMACLTLVACDLLTRPFAAPYLHYNPANMCSRKLPNLPILGRWDADIFYQAPAYGDLAAMKGEGKWREMRDVVVFQTDSAGFRNGTLHQPVDLILLGDSFTAWIGTSQDRIFARLLEDRPASLCSAAARASHPARCRSVPVR